MSLLVAHPGLLPTPVAADDRSSSAQLGWGDAPGDLFFAALEATFRTDAVRAAIASIPPSYGPAISRLSVCLSHTHARTLRVVRRVYAQLRPRSQQRGA